MQAWTGIFLGTGPNRERSNLVWNMIGSFLYAFASMVLSFLVLRIIGEEQGGIFSFGYSTFGQQMFILAYFGIRPFQVTDGAGQFSFGDYLRHRVVTCLLAVVASVLYLTRIGYSPEKVRILLLLAVYKILDGFIDVWESEFQRAGHLHLTGKSCAFRTVCSVGSFLLMLVLTRNLTAACLCAVTVQALAFLILDLPCALVLPGIRFPGSLRKAPALTAQTALLFVSVFLDFYIFSAAKYAVDAHMNDAANGYFNVIFMPTSVINLAAGFVIRPVLTGLTECRMGGHMREFGRKLGRISGLILALSALALALATGLGVWALGIMEKLLGENYAGKLTLYHSAFCLIVAGGACYALLNLYYYVLVILRRQSVIFVIYLLMTGVAACLAPRMVETGGIPGAAQVYLILMLLMTAAFVGCGLVGIRQEAVRTCGRKQERREGMSLQENGEEIHDRQSRR